MRIDKFKILSIMILFLAGCATLPDATTVVTRVSLTDTVQTTPTGLPLTETPSPEPTIEPTWTLPATLPVDDSLSKINELLQTNGGCRLPCWWGITPGQTKWEDARNILFPFAETILDGQRKKGEFLAGLITRYVTDRGTGFEQSYIIRDEVVQAIKIKLPFSIPSPKPRDIFADHGIPDEVYVGGSYEPGVQRWQSFWFFLYYAEQRIFVEYDQGFQPNQPGPSLSICFPEIDYVELHMWGQDYSFDQTRDLLIQQRGNSTKSLGEVTNLTVEQFYEKFTNPDEEPCFDTPAEDWLP